MVLGTHTPDCKGKTWRTCDTEGKIQLRQTYTIGVEVKAGNWSNIRETEREREMEREREVEREGGERELGRGGACLF